MRKARKRLRNAIMPQVGGTHKTFRYIWIAIYLGLIATFSYSLYRLVDKYLKYPTNMEVKIVSASELEFPAVTICNENPVQKSLISRLKLHKDLKYLDDYMQHHVQQLAGSDESCGEGKLCDKILINTLCFPSGIRPSADPKAPPFGTFLEIHFWPTDPKIFLKAPLAPIYTYFQGEGAPKKTRFFVKIFQKVPKNGFLTCFFFQKIVCGAKTFTKTAVF